MKKIQAANIKNSKEKTNKSVSTKKKSSKLLWPLKVFFIALFLSLIFSAVAETIMVGANLVVAIIVAVILIVIAVIADLIGVAVAVCDNTAFLSMAARRVKGAKMSIALLKKSDRVSSICNDVIGDICGILSGALGAAIVIKMALDADTILGMIMPVIVSSIIAALTISGKALAKTYAANHSQSIVFFVAKILTIFVPKRLK